MSMNMTSSIGMKTLQKYTTKKGLDKKWRPIKMTINLNLMLPTNDTTSKSIKMNKSMKMMASLRRGMKD